LEPLVRLITFDVNLAPGSEKFLQPSNIMYCVLFMSPVQIKDMKIVFSSGSQIVVPVPIGADYQTCFPEIS
jgi:hypothetical protein